MHLREMDRTIIKPNIGNSLKLPPARFPETFLKHWKNPNATIDGDNCNIGDCTDDFKVHDVLESIVRLKTPKL